MECDVKKLAFALAHVFLLLIWVHSLLASEPASYSNNNPGSQTVLATRQGGRTLVKGCPVEEATILDIPESVFWHQSEAYAGSRVHTAAQGPSEESSVPLATGAWFMGAGLIVFVISRKRFRS